MTDLMLNLEWKLIATVGGLHRGFRVLGINQAPAGKSSRLQLPL